MKLDPQAVLAKVRENLRKRDACAGHVFKRLARFMRVQCTHCGWEADITAATAYAQGIRHGGNKPPRVCASCGEVICSCKGDAIQSGGQS